MKKFKKYLWLIPLAFLAGGLFTLFTLAKSMGLFFVVVGVLVVGGGLSYCCSKNFGLTFLAVAVVGTVFLFGMWSVQKIGYAYAEANNPRQVDDIIIDGQDMTALIIPEAAVDTQTGESLPTFVPGNCVSSNYSESIRQWCDLIEKYAALYNVDPKLIASVMEMESGGDPHAGKTITNVDGVDYHCSRDGAIGLLQVMPRDGLSGAKYGSMFASRPSVAELYDAEFNIEYGIKMLSGLIVKYGSPHEALFHYGPSGCGYECYADPIMDSYKYK